ncbi:phospholipid scramblase 2-like [Branchiostoma lanceolatum]|uniref:phospholipid scramblase 2-like n=1 Tax=Branchiostoma lanceolatum TaxID=7740 RepID=UPI003453279C
MAYQPDSATGQPGYPGYPPPAQGYPPPQPVYPPLPAGGYPAGPPPQQGYPAPSQPAYPPPQQGYPPSPQPPGPGYGAPPGPQPGYGPPPGQIQWMQPPTRGPPGCPPGLEYLCEIDQLLVKQQVELLEAFIGIEGDNKYKIKNAMGQQVYFAAEDNDCCTRQCCGNVRSFEMKIFDNTQQEIIHFSRPLRCMNCFWVCCLQELEVQSPPGTTVGWVRQIWHPFLPKFEIEDAAGDVVLVIEGPCLSCSFCGDVEFDVMVPDESQKVGKISKQWSGLLKEAFTDADNLGIQFPMDLDVKVKATLLGALFLIDFMFFEQVGGEEQQSSVLF